MPDHTSNGLRHLRFAANARALSYSGTGRGSFTRYERDDRDKHVAFLRRQLDPIQGRFEDVTKERQEKRLSSDFGLILNVTSEAGYPLSYGSLEKAPTKNTQGIALLNVRREQAEAGEVTHAAVFVPYGQLDALEKKINEYADESKDSRTKEGEVTGPRNADLLNNIHSISLAAFDALWTDPEPLVGSDDVGWFELWIRRDGHKDWYAQLLRECARLKLEVSTETLTLPDHLVAVCCASRNQLESSLDLLNCLSEVRRARPCSMGLSDLASTEQEEWVDVTLERIVWPDGDAPAVCLLDTGVNRNHPLIEPILALEDMSTVFGDEDKADDRMLKHGTPMAGLAAFGDLRGLMLSSGEWEQSHCLESVKLIRSATPHKPENYGATTLSAINEPESISQRKRVFCLAVTAPGPNSFGNPSSWSTALDIAAAGAQAEDDEARVILVSTGNTNRHDDTFSYPDTLLDNPVEDPAQAWNVISVGAVTQRTSIDEDDDEARRCNPVAPHFNMSPFTRTSHAWCDGRKDWPIVPDVVMEGGNIGQNRHREDEFSYFDSLVPLSTATDFVRRPLTPFNATSAATALASRTAARIRHRYRDVRAETVRGLLVHSARWPQELLDRENLDPHRAGSTQQVQELMRSYGHGVVNERRALESLKNEATFFTEGEIQPYKGNAGNASLNECHLIALPWPKALLSENSGETFSLRVTLSYFIEPNPGTRSWDNGKKYKYASHLLGFTPKHAGHSMAEFHSRLNAEEASLGEALSDPGWALGDQLRRKGGSLIQDVWRGSAADLLGMEAIAVFPRAKGWWATRKYDEERKEHNCHLRYVPYSLVVSIETEKDLPVYTSVEAAILEATVAPDVDVTL